MVFVFFQFGIEFGNIILVVITKLSLQSKYSVTIGSQVYERSKSLRRHIKSVKPIHAAVDDVWVEFPGEPHGAISH